MAISREQVEKLRATLRAAPAAPAGSVDTTKQEAVRLLATEIKGLQQRGYTLEQVAEFLKGGGLDLATPTLKSYLSRAKSTRRRQRGGTRKEAVPGAKAPVSTVVAPRVNAVEAGGREKKEARTATPPPARTESRPMGPGDRAERDEVSSGTPDGKFRSGKDAFMGKDKDSY